MRRSVDTYIKLAVLVALALASVLANAAPPAFVYRGVDAPHPDEVFIRGFPSPGHDQDLLSHVNGLTCDSGETAFVSTTASEAFAYERAMYTLATNPGGRFYVYRIRADPNLYSTDTSLRAAHGHGWYEQLQDAADSYHHQEEWVSPNGIAASQVESVSIYRVSTETGELEHLGVRQNPSYVALDTRANDAALPVPSREPDGRRVISPSFSYPLVSACFACVGNRRAERRERSADGIEQPGYCEAFQVSTLATPTTVIDPITRRQVQRYVPWRTWRRSNYKSSFQGPVDCDIVPGSGVLTVNCATLRGATEFSVHLGAGGRRYTWVDKRYDDGVVGKLWGQLPSDIPVKGTRYTLADYGYRIRSVFSGNDSSWWSGVTVLPVYPVLSHASDDICLYKDAGYTNMLGCMRWNAGGARLVPAVNDEVSAIRASDRQRYQVCEDFGYAGRCFILKGNTDIARLHALGMNDKISSIRACNKPMPNTWKPPPRNHGVIGSIYAVDDPATGKREFYRLRTSTYGKLPASRQGNADWSYLEGYEAC
nr:hypothetical protein [uncultured Cupriavidus sp.]